MKVKIEIKSWLNDSVLFEYEKENNTIKDTLEEAARKSANLSYADLRNADLSGADLRNANLRNAYLWNADLRNADLWNADLSGADLRNASLWNASLWNADLWNADISGADLRNADLRNADFSGSRNIDSDMTDFWWHVHHDILVEQLNEPLRARINYIKKNKPKDEVELRLKLLKPVLGKIPTTENGWERLHKKECGCGWNGKTIFTNENGLEK